MATTLEHYRSFVFTWNTKGLHQTFWGVVTYSTTGNWNGIFLRWLPAVQPLEPLRFGSACVLLQPRKPSTMNFLALLHEQHIIIFSLW